MRPFKRADESGRRRGDAKGGEGAGKDGDAGAEGQAGKRRKDGEDSKAEKRGETGEDSRAGKAEGKKSSRRTPEARRSEGRRKLRAALDRAENKDDAEKPRRADRARPKGKAGEDEGVEGDGAKAKRERPKRERGETKRERPKDAAEGKRGGRPRKQRGKDEGKPHGSKRRGRKRGDDKTKRRRPSVRKRAGAYARTARSGALQVLAAAITVLAAAAALLFAVLGRVLAVVLRGWLLVRPPARWLTNRARLLTSAVSKLVTPKRVLALVVAGAAVLLALSQFADYRGVSIGNDAYTGLTSIAPPPEVERAEAGDPHLYLFAPLGLLCLPLLFVTLRGRLGASRLIAAVGVAAVLVAVVVDRPAGLDTTEAARSFEGVEATLLGGFYAQIAAGIVLVVASLLLARTIAAEAPARARRSQRASGSQKPRRGMRGAAA